MLQKLPWRYSAEGDKPSLDEPQPLYRTDSLNAPVKNRALSEAKTGLQRPKALSWEMLFQLEVDI